MSFDLLAPHYRWMERVLAGNKLQSCRNAYLSEATRGRRALLIGEGHGRFLETLLRFTDVGEVTCIDLSARMLHQARVHVESCPDAKKRVRLIHADIREADLNPCSYDLIATHFFLDCFTREQLAPIIARVAASATDGATWLLSDFCQPADGWRRVRARAILWIMYRFFRLTTHLPASRLTPPDPYLRQANFQLKERRTSEWGLLHADLWEKDVVG